MFYQNRQDYLFVKMTYNNSFLAHIHCQAEIFYVLDGAVEVTIANQTQLLKKGMLSIAFPNVVHKTYTPEHSSAILIIVHPNFLPDFSYELCKHLPQQPFISQIQNSDQFSKLMYHLLENTEKNTDIRVSKGYLYLILSAIISEIKLVRQETIPSDICQDIINYLNQHFTEELHLSHLANALGYSKYHISHIFKSKFGCSYNTYLKRLRSEYAMGLLTHSDMTVTEICFASGFSSLRSFYRTFHEIYGSAPRSIKR